MPVGARPLSNGMPSINSTTTFDELLAAVRAMPSTPPPALLSPSSENTAVARCCQAYSQAMKAAAAQHKNSYEQRADARRAYRETMPALTGQENIQNFVACVAHGMLIESIDGADGTRLLYAAQVAHTTARVLLCAPNPPLPMRRIHRRKSQIHS